VIYEQIAMQRLRPIDINQPATRSESALPQFTGPRRADRSPRLMPRFSMRT
jgi:hypothetical protein